MPRLGFTVRREVYEALLRQARERGVGLYEYVREVLERCAGSGNAVAPAEGGSRQPPDGLEGILDGVLEGLRRLEGRLAALERRLLPPLPPVGDGRPAVPEPTPEVLARLASKLAEREVPPDEYPGNLTAGEVLLLDRLVREGRAVYDRGSRRWRLVGVREGG